MHWWPILLILAPIVGGILLVILLISSGLSLAASEGQNLFDVLAGVGLGIIIIIVLIVLALTVLYVFMVIWHWKMFEHVGQPGWFSLSLLLIVPGTYIPAAGPYVQMAGWLLLMVFLGIAAWSKKGGKDPLGSIPSKGEKKSSLDKIPEAGNK